MGLLVRRRSPFKATPPFPEEADSCSNTNWAQEDMTTMGRAEEFGRHRHSTHTYAHTKNLSWQKNERCGREGREAKGNHLIFVPGGGGGEEGSGAEYFRADCQLFIWLAEGMLQAPVMRGLLWICIRYVYTVGFNENLHILFSLNFSLVILQIRQKSWWCLKEFK